MAEVLRAGDITIGSLDGALSDISPPSPCPQTMNLVGPTRMAEGFVYAGIKDQISHSRVVGSDETSAQVDGKKWWMWVWQNLFNTFIVASDNRGSQTIEAECSEGLPQATLVSDRSRGTVENDEWRKSNLFGAFVERGQIFGRIGKGRIC